MNFLEEKILTTGVIKEGNILKVDSFLNHQIDIDIMRQMAYEFKRRFRGVEVNKVLTIEASGIAIATLLGDLYDVPVVLRRRVRRPIVPMTNISPTPIPSPIRSSTMSLSPNPISTPQTRC